MANRMRARFADRTQMRPLLFMILLTTPAELLLAQVLIPVAWLRWLLLVGAAVGAGWLVHVYRSLPAPNRRS